MMTNPHVKSCEPVKVRASTGSLTATNAADIRQTSKGLCKTTPNTACQEVPRGAADSEHRLSDSESEASLASA